MVRTTRHHSTGITRVWLYYVYGLLLLSLSVIAPFNIAETVNSCCAQHQGVCGVQCCDGKPLSTNTGCGHTYVFLPKLEKEDSDTETPKLSPQTQQRIYIWQNRYNKIQMMSGNPPPWYRNRDYPNNYPRVLVYDNYGRLIDDTSLAKDNTTVKRLRDTALSITTQQGKDKTKPTSPPATQQNAHTLVAVVEGMTKQQVSAVWGRPMTQKMEIQGSDLVHIWNYQNGNQVTFSTTTKKAIDVQQNATANSNNLLKNLSDALKVFSQGVQQIQP